MPIELVHLADARFTLREPIALPDTPLGTRVIAEVASAEFDGERFKATLKGVAAADWVTFDSRGLGTLDVRVTLETRSSRSSSSMARAIGSSVSAGSFVC